MSSELKRMCLEKAISFLQAAGADYIITFNGEIFASQVPVIEEPATKKKRTVVNNFVTDTDYVNKVRSLQKGGVLRFTRAVFDVLKDPKAYNSFHASLHSQCRRVFGADGFVFRKTPEYIEVMRTV